MNCKQIIFYLCIVSMSSINAQIQPKPIEHKIPAINQHKFLSNSHLRSAFVATSLQSDIGFGTTSLIKIPGIEIGNQELFSFQGKIFYMDFNLQYQQKFTSWLALYMSVKLTGRIGSDLSTIVADGLNTVSGGDIGWLIKIKETDKLYLSGTIKANNIVGSFVNVADYLEDVIDGEPYPSLTKKTPASSVGIGLRSAYAFNPIYGLQVDLNAIHGESLQRGASDTYYSFSILGDMDLNNLNNTPIAFAIGYSLSSTPEISMNNRGFSNFS